MARRRERSSGRRGAHASGSARRRRRPVTPERVLAALERRGRALTTPAALASALGVGRGSGKQIRGALRRLESEGRVERIRGRFRARGRGNGSLEGVYTREGRSGAVVDDSGRRWRVDTSYDARPGDRVAIQPWGEPRDARADVLAVVEGARDHWVGILHRRGRLAFVTPYRDDGEWLLRVARSDTGGAEEGDVVVLAPVPPRGGGRRSADASPWARVTRRLGRPGDAEADVVAVVWRHRLPGPFPPALEQEAADVAGARLDAEIARRVDLRALPFVTIDPPGARDHDDAITLSERGDGTRRLHVAIADVSHYVAAGSPLDHEALRRGNSVYFPDRALPMLPAALSGDACSLRPGVDRLALVGELDYDGEGRLLRRSFFPAVIRSRAHLSYDEAAAVMTRGAAHAHAPMLRALDALADQLARRRRAAGALSLVLPEVAVRLDPEGRPVDVFSAAQSVAHRAVEEAMLATNLAVASLLLAAKLPAVFRNHEPPAPDDLLVLERVLKRLGLHDSRAPLDARALAAALRRTPAELVRVVHPIALRAMRQARYGAECRGHFALACDAYLHFTSPIRRYPDLVVHRVLKALLAGAPARLERLRAERIAARCSFRERLAERAERELVDLKKCVFLAPFIGRAFAGCVTSVARHGLYVTLDRWPVAGLVHVSTLPELVSLEEDGLSLRASGSRRRYALGDRLEVVVAAVDPVRARIDFRIRRRLESSPLFAG